MNKTLHLNLKRKWFDMIFSGEKKEEYRDIKKHWARQLCYKIECPPWGSGSYMSCISQLLAGNYSFIDNKIAFEGWNVMDGEFNGPPPFADHFDTITFSNGYKKDRPQFEIELKSIKIDTGKTEWGAIENEKYFVLELGEIIGNIHDK